MSSIGEIALEMEAAGLLLKGDTGATGATGGLSDFTDTLSTTGINATIPVAMLTATNASYANIDVSILTKGTGSLVSGNMVNKCGANSVSLQPGGVSAAWGANSAIISPGSTGNQIASTSTSSIICGGILGCIIADSGSSAVLGGVTNKINTGSSNAIVGGSTNNIDGLYGTILGGVSNTIALTSNKSSIIGGTLNTVTALGSVIIGGTTNTSTGGYAIMLGGSTCTTSGAYSVTMGYKASNPTQTKFVQGNTKTDSTLVVTQQGGVLTLSAVSNVSSGAVRPMTATGAGTAVLSAINHLTCPINSAVSFTGTIVAKENSATNYAAWTVSGLLTVGATLSATTLVVNTVTAISNTPAWTAPALSADTTYGGLTINIVSSATVNAICYTAQLLTSEVTTFA